MSRFQPRTNLEDLLYTSLVDCISFALKANALLLLNQHN